MRLAPPLGLTGDLVLIRPDSPVVTVAATGASFVGTGEVRRCCLVFAVLLALSVVVDGTSASRTGLAVELDHLFGSAALSL